MDSTNIVQVLITVFSAGAIFLLSDKRHSWNKWGHVCGLCSQPFWFLTIQLPEQWGLFTLSVLYTILWIRGIYNHLFMPWYKKRKQNSNDKV